MMSDVGSVDQFRVGADHQRIFRVSIGGRDLCVAFWGDKVYAFASTCPHQLGPLWKGRLLPGLESSSVGSIRKAEQVVLVACPWHGWEFDLASGRSIWGGRLKTYPARLEAGRVLVDVGDSA